MTVTKYQIAIGHGGTASLADVDPQPRSFGMRSGRRTLAGDGLQYEDGFRSASWLFGYLTKAQYTALLAQCGLGEGTPSAQVTVATTRNSNRAFAYYNATILKPESPDEARFEMTVWHDLEFKLIRLEEL